MSQQLDRNGLVDLVQRIIDAEGSEEEIDRWIDLLEEHLPHPAVTDLIFYSDPELSAEEIIDTALRYQPKLVP